MTVQNRPFSTAEHATVMTTPEHVDQKPLVIGHLVLSKPGSDVSAADKGQ